MATKADAALAFLFALAEVSCASNPTVAQCQRLLEEGGGPGKRKVLERLTTADTSDKYRELATLTVEHGKYFNEDGRQGYKWERTEKGGTTYEVRVFLDSSLQFKGFRAKEFRNAKDEARSGRVMVADLDEHSPWDDFNPWYEDSFTAGVTHCDRDHEQSVEMRPRETPTGTRQWMYCRQKDEVNTGADGLVRRIIAPRKGN